MTAYDLYRYLDAALNVYTDSILLKEDPTESERKNYEYVKYWRPSEPDSIVKNILSSIELSSGDKSGQKE